MWLRVRSLVWWLLLLLLLVADREPQLCRALVVATRDNHLLSRIAQFAVNVFSGHTQWHYSRREERWQLGRASLAILRDVLQDLSEAHSGDHHSSSADASAAAGGATTPRPAWGSHRVAGADRDPLASQRDTLLTAFLRDQSLQSSLVTAATLPASSAFADPSVGEATGAAAAAGGGSGSGSGSGGMPGGTLLPVDFDMGLLGVIRSPSERLQVDALTRCALAVLCVILEAREDTAPVGADGAVWNAAAKVGMLTRRLGTSEFSRSAAAARVGAHTPGMGHGGKAGGDDMDVAMSAGRQPNRNVVVALAAMIGYPKVSAVAVLAVCVCVCVCVWPVCVCGCVCVCVCGCLCGAVCMGFCDQGPTPNAGG